MAGDKRVQRCEHREQSEIPGWRKVLFVMEASPAETAEHERNLPRGCYACNSGADRYSGELDGMADSGPSQRRAPGPNVAFPLGPRRPRETAPAEKAPAARLDHNSVAETEVTYLARTLRCRRLNELDLDARGQH